MSGCHSEAGRLFQILGPGPATEKLPSPGGMFVLGTVRTLAWAERWCHYLWMWCDVDGCCAEKRIWWWEQSYAASAAGRFVMSAHTTATQCLLSAVLTAHILHVFEHEELFSHCVVCCSIKLYCLGTESHMSSSNVSRRAVTLWSWEVSKQEDF